MKEVTSMMTLMHILPMIVSLSTGKVDQWLRLLVWLVHMYLWTTHCCRRSWWSCTTRCCCCLCCCTQPASQTHPGSSRRNRCLSGGSWRRSQQVPVAATWRDWEWQWDGEIYWPGITPVLPVIQSYRRFHLFFLGKRLSVLDIIRPFLWLFMTLQPRRLLSRRIKRNLPLVETQPQNVFITDILTFSLITCLLARLSSLQWKWILNSNTFSTDDLGLTKEKDYVTVNAIMKSLVNVLWFMILIIAFTFYTSKPTSCSHKALGLSCTPGGKWILSMLYLKCLY